MIVNETTEVGIKIIGAAQSGYIGYGVFWNSDEDRIKVSTGSFIGWGGFVGGLGGTEAWGVNYPKTDQPINFALGAFAGAGASIFYTTADSASELVGVAPVLSFNLGSGARTVTIQISKAKDGPWLFVGGFPPLPGAGLGASVSAYHTDTMLTVDLPLLEINKNPAQANPVITPLNDLNRSASDPKAMYCHPRE